MISPWLKDDAFLEDFRRAEAIEPGSLHVWWLGQSGFLVQWNRHTCLFDPYLSDSLTRKYAATDKPHVRMTERVIDPARLSGIDVATSSHNHTDHLDAETLLPLLHANPDVQVVVPAANRAFAAARLGLPPDRLAPARCGEPLVIGPFTFHTVPAAHEEIEYDVDKNPFCVGYVLNLGPWTLYHSGDTVKNAEVTAALRGFQIDLAFLPINGRAPERRVAGNLWGNEAVELAHEVGIGCVIPCHYDLFTFNTATTELFERTSKNLQQSIRILRNGQRVSFRR